MTTSNNKRLITILAAAGSSICVGSSAKADFVISVVGPTATALPGYSDYVLKALNNGLDGTGTNLLAVDATINSTGDMYIDLNADIDGDSKKDADVIGFPDKTLGTATPTFGGTAVNGLGTFVGVPQTASGLTASTSFSITGIQLDANVGTPNENNYETTQGAIDPAFLNGTVTSMRIVGAFTSANFKGPAANSTAVPFANIVVPTGTSFSVVGSLAGDQGAVQPFDTVVNIAPQLFGLQGSAANGGTDDAPAFGAADVSDVVQAGTSPETAAVTNTKGSFAYSGFAQGSNVDIGLKLGLIYNGPPLDPDASEIAAIVSYINANDGGAAIASAYSSAPADVTNALGAGNYDILLSDVAGANDPYCFYDFSGFTGGPSFQVTEIGVDSVPEPASLSLIGLAAGGLLARRRRKA